MNVSFTRARKKLVIFGSRKTLMREPLLSQFFELMHRNDWILTLPRGADKAHSGVFDLYAVPAKRVKDASEDMDSVIEVKQKNNESRTVARVPGKENSSAKEARPTKKLKGNAKAAGVGVLSGRPILQDLVSNET
jgi:DNA replication ATP-dependent helicase Dna2